MIILFHFSQQTRRIRFFGKSTHDNFVNRSTFQLIDTYHNWVVIFFLQFFRLNQDISILCKCANLHTVTFRCLSFYIELENPSPFFYWLFNSWWCRSQILIPISKSFFDSFVCIDLSISIFE